MAYFDRKRKLDKQESNQESDVEAADDGNSEAASSKTSARQKRKPTRQSLKRRWAECFTGEQ